MRPAATIVEANGEAALSALVRVSTKSAPSVDLVRRVHVEVAPGRSLGIVGESGSGKTLLLRAIMGILPSGLEASGEITFSGEALPLRGNRLGKARRGRLAMIFQDPLAALDPVMTIGDQVAEVPRRIEGLSRATARQRTIELLRMVRLPDPEDRLGAYPHQLSGGLRQRVMIAVALASRPRVLLCDEPTTALDVTIQAEILALLDELRETLGVAIVLVSHDLAVIGDVCDSVVVMYSGDVVERGSVDAILHRPRHPYTVGLLHATPDVAGPVVMPESIPGRLPDPARRGHGCPFAPRCYLAELACTTGPVPLVELQTEGSPHATACRRHALVTL